MAQYFVPNMIDHLSGLLAPPLVNKLPLDAKGELQIINHRLKKMETFLHDAECRKVKEQAVWEWLTKLEGVIYEIEEVLDGWNIVKPKAVGLGAPVKARRMLPHLKKVRSLMTQFLCSYPTKMSVLENISLKIEEISGKLEDIEIQAGPFNFDTTVNQNGVPNPILTTPFIFDESEVHGREADKNSLLEHLVPETENRINIVRARGKKIKVISVVGLTGYGKTTLAQLVYNNARVVEYFQLKAWVCVSNNFDERRCAEALLDSSGIPYAHNLELTSLVKLVQKSFSGKIFLCVFDDVWIDEFSKWMQFSNALKNGARGSIILMTTRSEKVAREVCTDYLHRLYPLSKEDCWSILKHKALHVGRSSRVNKRLKKIGWEIAKKCNGLPVVANVLGEKLFFLDSEKDWNEVLDSEIWQIEEVARELFHYDMLSPQLKLCITLFAEFLENTAINVDQLIRLWIAKGYLGLPGQGDNKSMEMKGIECFHDLVNFSFFQLLVKGSIHKNQITSCKLHDAFFDFIKQKPLASAVLESRKRTFRIFLDSDQVPTKDLCTHWKYMRALVLCSCGLEEISSEVGDLNHLQYLDLSGNPLKELPEKLCNLQSLVFLDVHSCHLLSCLPQGIGAITQLEHLRIDHTTAELHNLPQGFKELTLVRTLDVFMAGGRYEDAIKKLQGLNHLEEICIVVHGQVHFPDAYLQRKARMDNLELCFAGDGQDPGKVSSINDLQPPPYLQMLKFEKYPGSKLPEWILEEPLINKLRRLSLISALNLSSLPALCKLPSLEFLWLYDIPNLKHLGCEFLGLPHSEKKYQRTWSYKSEDGDEEINIDSEDDDDDIDHDFSIALRLLFDADDVDTEYDNEKAGAFRSLKTLQIECLQNWETWEDLDEDSEAEMNRIPVMPSLEKLIIHSCPKLSALPYKILEKIPSLRIEVNDQPCHINGPTGDKSGSLKGNWIRTKERLTRGV